MSKLNTKNSPATNKTPATPEQGKPKRAKKSHFTLDAFATSTTTLTKRTQHRNISDDLFLISPDWTASASHASVSKWHTHMMSLNRQQQFTLDFQKYIPPLLEAHTTTAFSAAFDNLLNDGLYNLNKLSVGTRAKARSRILELVTCLWSDGLLMFPAKRHPLLAQANLTHEVWGFTASTAVKKVLDDIRDASSYDNEKSNRNRFIFMTQMLLPASSPSDIGDIDPKTHQVNFETSKGQVCSPKVIAGVLLLQKEAYPKESSFRPIQFGVKSKSDKSSREDKEFLWATVKDGGMEQWRKMGAEYLLSIPRGWDFHITGINSWFDYLLEHPELSKDPLKFLDRSNQTSYSDFKSMETNSADKRLVLVHDFLQHILLAHCSAPDDFGNPQVLPRFKNPIRRPIRKGANATETHREPMPTRFVNLCMEILTENDYAWPKSLSKDDQFKWRNPATQKLENRWSPIRTWFLILKLLLPSRTFQLRMLDSGESDTETYHPNQGGWIKNTGKLQVASGKKRDQKGVFRKYQRKDGSYGSLLYFNTNKTADIDVDPEKMGYLMPWENQEAIKYLLMARDWQAEFNPISKPSLWLDMPEFKKRRHEDVLKKMGTACFLFRDPIDFKHPEFPVSDGRIRSLWVKLMEELERRLEASGDRLPNGAPHKIIATRSESGYPISATFDLHSLRVTMITALYEQGVKPEIIMKIVGHASVLMTLYYTKIAPHAITDTLNEAMIKRQQTEQTQWIGFLQHKSREQLTQLTAHNHTSGLDALSETSGSSIVVMDHGFCSMATRRCSDGLLIRPATTSSSPVCAPVPGGASNCVRCRFFVTGPAFLVGMEAHVNDLAYRLKNKSKAYQQAQKEFDELEHERTSLLEQGQPFVKNRDLQIAESAFEKSTADVDQVALSLQSAYALTEQSLALMNNEKTEDSSEFSLIVSGGGHIDAILEESHAFEQIHRLCSSATFFKSLSIDTQQADLERFRFFDQMLARSNMTPRFILIDNTKVARNIADEMGRFLYSRLTKREVAMLMDGQTTLAALGLDKTFTQQIDLIGQKLAPQASASPLLINKDPHHDH